jgi:CheY-like chemotaxis protein
MSEALSTAYEQFSNWVHEALNRLYDSPYLQSHPLADLLIEPGSSALSRSQNLRQILLDAIQDIVPRAGVPAMSPDRRIHRLLELRYVEGMNPAQVMRELALSRSQYFREQARAVEMVAQVLWQHWRESEQQMDPEGPESFDGLNRRALARDQVERLLARATWGPVEVNGIIHGLRAVIDPLAQARTVSVSYHLRYPLTVLHADRVVLRQVLLSLVAYGLDRAARGSMEIGSFADQTHAGLTVLVLRAGDGLGETSLPEAVEMEICARLTMAMGGSLSLSGNSQSWEARLGWPVGGPMTLLMIDDNEGMIDLFRRYLSGSQWRVIGAINGAEARQIVAKTQPTAIVLDVMMPDEDGWEFLLSLKCADATKDFPVIICSVLQEPQVALTLGAAAYLPKPVTREALLRALAPWTQDGASLLPASGRVPPTPARSLRVESPQP